MSSTKKTLEQIADILSYHSNTSNLQDKIIKNTVDWDEIVKLASSHLVLTTVYCRLKQKELLSFIPKDLTIYLEELTTINRNRNRSLFSELKTLSSLLNYHKINHVFLKGTALLAGNFYQDFGERMIGDIDILVSVNDSEKAYNIILNEGYSKISETISDKYLEKRHLPRLVNPSKIGAIEIHTHLINNRNSTYLNPITILTEKVIINSIAIPKNKHLLEHIILNFQINDNGYYFSNFHFRNAYDTLILLNKLSYNVSYEKRYFKNYFLLLSVFFDTIKLSKNKFDSIRIWIFKFGLIYPRYDSFRKNVLSFLLYSIILLKRLKLFVLNKNYRKDILETKIMLKNL